MKKMLCGNLRSSVTTIPWLFKELSFSASAKHILPTRQVEAEKPTQFIPSTNLDCYTYFQNGSKTLSGLKSKEGKKVVPAYACHDSRTRCLVYLLDTYFSKFSPM